MTHIFIAGRGRGGVVAFCLAPSADAGASVARILDALQGVSRIDELDLPRLHSSHAVTRFDIELSPPLATGTL